MHTAVQSATLATIGYDSARGILQQEFGNRVFYRYFGVPGPVYDALWAAPSKGRYFNLGFVDVFRIRWSRAQNPVGGVNGDGANRGSVTLRQSDYGLHQFGAGGKDVPPEKDSRCICSRPAGKCCGACWRESSG